MALWTFLGTYRRTAKQIEADLEQVPVFHRQYYPKIYHPKPGRPRVSAESKRQKANARQRDYRQRMKSLIDQARALGCTSS